MTQSLKIYRRNKQRLISKGRKSQREQKNESWFFDEKDNQEVEGFLIQRFYDKVSQRQELERTEYDNSCRETLATLVYVFKISRSNPKNHF